MKYQNFKQGFTLIELLIVIAIIGILSSIILTSLNNSRVRGYDSKIKQQLRNFRSAAELYYNNQSPTSYGAATNSCAAGMFADNASANGNPNAYLQFTGVNPTPTLVCNTDGVTYAIQSNLISGGYWCSDSKGNSKVEANPLGAATICP